MNRGRTDAEGARIDDLEQVHIFLVAAEILLEEGGVVVVELAAGEPVSPPRGFLLQFVERVFLDELRACGNRVFDQQVSPVAAVDAEMHGDYVPGMDIARERLQVIDDLFFFLQIGLGGFTALANLLTVVSVPGTRLFNYAFSAS